MRKAATIGLIIILIGAFAFYYYTILMPKKLSDSIVDEEKDIPKFIPKKYKQHVIVFKKEVKDNSEKVMDYIESKEVTIEDLLHFIDEIKLEDIEVLASNIDSTHLNSSENLYRYIVENFNFQDIPIKNFKNDFIQKIDSTKINKAYQYYKNNEEQLPIIFPVAKETIKKVIIKKRTEIEEKLNGDSTGIGEVFE